MTTSSHICVFSQHIEDLPIGVAHELQEGKPHKPLMQW